MSEDVPGSRVVQVSVPDIRDYERINAELIELLHEGHSHVRLAGAEGQRFLAAGLSGSWNAVVEVEGRAGPELAAGLNAPGITVVCQGFAADAAGRGLRAGRLLLLGDVGDGLAYAQIGGTILAVRDAGHRAGLNQRGGVLAVLGRLGRLAGERQAGGDFFAFAERLGPHAGRGSRAGRFVRIPEGDSPWGKLEPLDLETLKTTAAAFRPWLGERKVLLP